jgi:hypothetical protein
MVDHLPKAMKCPPPPPAPVITGEIPIDFGAMRESFDTITEMVEQLRDSYRNWRGEVLFPAPDPRQGEEVYVYDLLPGCRVFVLEDVFTVDRVDMDAILPTVWLKELPTSPLYFTEYEYIYLATEPEERP